jgi:hypothetical protein
MSDTILCHLCHEHEATSYRTTYLYNDDTGEQEQTLTPVCEDCLDAIRALVAESLQQYRRQESRRCRHRRQR